MIEAITLGLIQGIAEWLPVSSESLVILAHNHLFGNGTPLDELVRFALFLHIGTFFAALVYFRNDLISFSKTIVAYRRAHTEEKKMLYFLVISTLITGTISVFILKSFVNAFDGNAPFAGLSAVIGILLVFTGIIEMRAKKREFRDVRHLDPYDGVALGIIQAFAVLPGLSRSGLTIAGLLVRKVDKTVALKLSFLMSLPVILGGNIALNFHTFTFSPENLLSVVIAFLSGIASIHIFLKISEHVNFSHFATSFGVLMIAMAFM